MEAEWVSKWGGFGGPECHHHVEFLQHTIMKTQTPYHHTNRILSLRNRYFCLLAGCASVLLFSCAANAAPSKWEYKVVNAGLNNAELESLLNSNGSKGWELVQINTRGIAVFKRRK
jgi:hypothetical protein